MTSDDERVVEYTMDRYESLLEEIRSAGRQFVGFDRLDDAAPGAVVLRHDVDLSIERALAMARREAELDVQSTYCVLLTTPLYGLQRPAEQRALDEIRALGHDVALHFDVHHHFDGRPDRETLVERVTAEMEALERVAGTPVDTVSFHIPPAWVLDEPFDAFVNTYAPAFFGDVSYVSDSSQKWCDEPPFPEGIPETFQLLVHPGLWNESHRSMADVLAAQAERAHRSVDQYVDLFGS